MYCFLPNGFRVANRMNLIVSVDFWLFRSDGPETYWKGTEISVPLKSNFDEPKNFWCPIDLLQSARKDTKISVGRLVFDIKI